MIMPEEMLGLLAHGALQVIPIVGQEFLGGRHLADIIEFEPDPREVAHEALSLRVGKHAFRLLAYVRRFTECAGCGELE